MLSIGENEITHYHEEGFVVSQNYLSDEIMNKISKCYDDFVATNPSLTLEEMASPHIYGGVNKLLFTILICFIVLMQTFRKIQEKLLFSDICHHLVCLIEIFLIELVRMVLNMSFKKGQFF